MITTAVYNVYPVSSLSAQWSVFAEELDRLHGAILTAAAKQSTPVYLMKISKTEHNAEIGGTVGVIIECTPAFLETIKTLPDFGYAGEGGGGYDVERDRKISAPAPRPARGLKH